MSKKLHAKEALKLLREAVADRGPENTYKSPIDHPAADTSSGGCYYVHHTDAGMVPGCIVGEVLVRSGRLTLEDLDYLEGSAPEVLTEDYLTPKVADPVLTDRAATVLALAQNVQDSFKPYGDALAAAEDYVRRTS